MYHLKVYIHEIADKKTDDIKNFIVRIEDKDEITSRKNELDRALSLGNLEHVKIKIYFEDDKSKKMVETTIWGVTDSRVILKQGVVIPVNRIHKIV